MFGDSSLVMMTEEEKNGKHFIDIPYGEKSSDIKWIRFEPRLGVVSFLDKEYKTITKMIMPDDALARWLSTDPKENEFPHLTPYNFVENKPILMNDPTGESGIVTIEGNTITVTSHIVFYGEKIDADLYAKRIENNWNDFSSRSRKIAMEDGREYTVVFKVTAEYVSDKVAQKQIATNKSYKNNYIRIVDEKGTDHMTGSSFMNANEDKIPGNTGVWSLNQISAKDETTSTHEYGHGLGLNHDLIYGSYHPTKGHFIPYSEPQEVKNYIDCQVPHMLQPRGSFEDKEYSYTTSQNKGMFGKQYIMDPKYRKVTNYNIATLGLTLNKKHLGALTNKYHMSETEKVKYHKKKEREALKKQIQSREDKN